VEDGVRGLQQHGRTAGQSSPTRPLACCAKIPAPAASHGVTCLRAAAVPKMAWPPFTAAACCGTSAPAIPGAATSTAPGPAGVDGARARPRRPSRRGARAARLPAQRASWTPFHAGTQRARRTRRPGSRRSGRACAAGPHAAVSSQPPAPDKSARPSLDALLLRSAFARGSAPQTEILIINGIDQPRITCATRLCRASQRGR
jgi:hypothetical protein